MKTALLKNFKNSLNTKSRWYDDDVADFKSNLNKVSESRLKEMYCRMIGSKKFEKFVAKEEKKLLKAGMYNMKNMQPQNCLD